MIKDWFSLEHFRHRLAHVDALPQLVVIGLLSGIATGLLIILFRLTVDLSQQFLLPSGLSEDFESLSYIQRFLFPAAGSVLLFLLLFRLRPEQRRVGPAHVLERMGYHQAHLPLSNLLVQFFGGATSLISGHSVGREGPAIHLGAGFSSLLGQWFKLPNNSLRILVGCGTAAAIAAAFNTPLAGVVFAMEVVMLEYTVVGFTPVVVAAVAADIMVRFTLGSEIDLAVPILEVETLNEIPYIMFVGFCIGCLAALFNRIMVKTQSYGKHPLSLRLGIAALLIGSVALVYPQLMGVGYDTLSAALNGELALGLLIGLMVTKLIITPITLGLGVPGGIIGPSFMVGALAGGALGLIGDHMTNQPVAHVGFYAMLGMGAMMGALLNAPLAALIALLELTGNPNIILPAMIAIVTSNLTVRYLFGLPSVFVSSLRALGLDYHYEPITQAMSGIAVSSLITRDFISVPQEIDRDTAKSLNLEAHHWLLIDGKERFLLDPSDLLTYLARKPDQATIDLAHIPALHRDLLEISYRATLHEALDLMNETELDAVIVTDLNQRVLGILTRDHIEQSYRNNLRQ
ncbi:chloride channel protein [Pontibacterium sp.]|uniref:chloride channel protein n=1 Tax=Pontibacterium sp. TaxID=2036026 RepID=UPI00356551DD